VVRRRKHHHQRAPASRDGGRGAEAGSAAWRDGGKSRSKGANTLDTHDYAAESRVVASIEARLAECETALGHMDQREVGWRAQAGAHAGNFLAGLEQGERAYANLFQVDKDNPKNPLHKRNFELCMNVFQDRQLGVRRR
jgi:hypothetical protein